MDKQKLIQLLILGVNGDIIGNVWLASSGKLLLSGTADAVGVKGI